MSDSTSTPTVAAAERDADRTGLLRTGITVGGIVAAALVATVVAALATVRLVGRGAGTTLTFVVTTVGTELAFLLVGGAYLRLRSSFRLPVTMPTRAAVPYLVGGLVASFATAFLSLAITDAMVPAIELSPGYRQYSGLGTVSGTGLVFGVILSLLLVGPAEELFFRGVIQGRLRDALGPVTAIGIAGVVFALFHTYTVALLSPPAVVLVHMGVYYTLMGAVFGWVYHRTETLVGPALVHGTFNAIVFSIPLLT